MFHTNNLTMLLTLITITSLGMFGDIEHARAAEPLGGIVPPAKVSRRYATNFAKTHDKGPTAWVMGSTTWRKFKISPSILGEEGQDEKAFSPGVSAGLGWLVREQLSIEATLAAEFGTDQPAVGFGPGLTYFFTPHGMTYLRGRVQAVTATDSSPDIALGQQWAGQVGVELGTGWWVADHMALSVGLSADIIGPNLDPDFIKLSGSQVGMKFGLHFD